MQKRLNRDHMLIHLMYQATAAFPYAFGTYTLLSRGFTPGTIGILLAIADMTGFIFQMFIANYLDNSKKYNVFEAATFLSFLVALFNIFNHLLRLPDLLLATVYVISMTLFNSLYPLTNSMSKIFNDNGFAIHFGVARACGSFSFGVISIVYGFITARFNYTYVTGSLIVFSIFLMLIFYATNRHFSQIETKNIDRNEEETISYKEFLLGHKKFLIICIGISCLMCGLAVTEYFMLPIVESMGGSSLDSGIIQGVKAILEVPVISNFHKIEKRFRLYDIIVISGLCHVLKVFILCISDSLIPVYISQILQCTSFALLTPAVISYINSTIGSKELLRGHALTAMSNTIIGIICNSLGGYVIDLYGTKAMCLMATFITMLGTIIMILFLEKDVRNKETV